MLRIFDCMQEKPEGALPLLKEQLYCKDAHDFNLVRVEPNFVKAPHPYEEGDSFMLVLSGLLHLVVDGERHSLTPGHLAFIPQGATRGFCSGPEGATFFAAHLRG